MGSRKTIAAINTELLLIVAFLQFDEREKQEKQ